MVGRKTAKHRAKFAVLKCKSFIQTMVRWVLEGTKDYFTVGQRLGVHR